MLLTSRRRLLAGLAFAGLARPAFAQDDALVSCDTEVEASQGWTAKLSRAYAEPVKVKLSTTFPDDFLDMRGLTLSPEAAADELVTTMILYADYDPARADALVWTEAKLYMGDLVDDTGAQVTDFVSHTRAGAHANDAVGVLNTADETEITMSTGKKDPTHLMRQLLASQTLYVTVRSASRSSNYLELGVNLAGTNEAVDGSLQAARDLWAKSENGDCLPSDDWSDLDLDDCFLTTAAVGVVGLADDCWELQTLRAFRDGPLKAMPGGGALADDYYVRAPRIVRAINARADAAKVWLAVYWTGIVPAALAAAARLDRLALALYRRLVERLEQLAG